MFHHTHKLHFRSHFGTKFSSRRIQMRPCWMLPFVSFQITGDILHIVQGCWAVLIQWDLSVQPYLFAASIATTRYKIHTSLMVKKPGTYYVLGVGIFLFPTRKVLQIRHRIGGQHGDGTSMLIISGSVYASLADSANLFLIVLLHFLLVRRRAHEIDTKQNLKTLRWVWPESIFFHPVVFEPY